MTPERSGAYSRLMNLIEGFGAELLPEERDQIRLLGLAPLVRHGIGRTLERDAQPPLHQPRLPAELRSRTQYQLAECAADQSHPIGCQAYAVW